MSDDCAPLFVILLVMAAFWLGLETDIITIGSITPVVEFTR